MAFLFIMSSTMLQLHDFVTQTSPQTLHTEIVQYFGYSQTTENHLTQLAIIPQGLRPETGYAQAHIYDLISQQKPDGLIIIETHQESDQHYTSQQPFSTLMGHSIPSARTSLDIAIPRRCNIDDERIEASTTWSYQLPFVITSGSLPIIPLSISTTSTADTQLAQEIHQLTSGHRIMIILIDTGRQTSSHKKTHLHQQDQDIIRGLVDHHSSDSSLPPIYSLARQLASVYDAQRQLQSYLHPDHTAQSHSIRSYIGMIA